MRFKQKFKEISNPQDISNENLNSYLLNLYKDNSNKYLNWFLEIFYWRR